VFGGHGVTYFTALGRRWAISGCMADIATHAEIVSILRAMAAAEHRLPVRDALHRLVDRYTTVRVASDAAPLARPLPTGEPVRVTSFA